MRINQFRSAVRLAVFVVIGILFWKGGQNIYSARRDSRQTVMSCLEYAEKSPKAAWLVLTNCVLDLPSSAYKFYGTDSNRPVELFIPLRGSFAPGSRACAVMATTDPELMETFREMQGLKSPYAVSSWLENNQKRAFPRRTVSGMVRSGAKLDPGQREQLMRLNKGLTKDFIVLNDGTRPSFVAGVSFLGAGALVLGALVLRLCRKA